LGDILKVLGISFLILAAITAAGNYYYGAGGCIQVTSVSEKDMNSEMFMSEMHAYDDMLVFRYIPYDTNVTGNYYVTYSIKTDGNTPAAQGSGLYENISVDRPVAVEIPRESDSLYEIEMLIEDMQGNLVHRSITRVGPQGQ
jgi:hypothetical protein